MTAETNTAAHSTILSALTGPTLLSQRHATAAVQTYRAGAVAVPVSDEQARRIIVESDDDFWQDGDSYRGYGRPYQVRNGSLVLPVTGLLLNDFSYSYPWATGYEYIRRAYDRAAADDNVGEIALLVNSFGGEARGMMELSRYIRQSQTDKKVIAYVNHYALSAGYGIASAADEVVVSSSGLTGSVGVLVTHVSYEKLYADIGIEVTFIKAGAKKTDANQYEGLTDQAREDLQERVDSLYDDFTALVSTNRRISVESVKNTEADIYESSESLEVSFADRIGDIKLELERRSNTTRGMTMGDKASTKVTGGGVDEASAAAVQAAVHEERKRFSAVMSLESYNGREALASQLLSTTGMTAEEIGAALSAAPAPVPAATQPVSAPPEATRNHFSEHMDKLGTPGVAADEDSVNSNPTPGSPEHTDSQVSTILSNYRAAGGRVRSRS